MEPIELLERYFNDIEEWREEFNAKLENMLTEARKNIDVTHDEFIDLYHTIKANKLLGTVHEPRYK